MHLKKLFAWGAHHGRKERERAFLENGGLVLEKLVAACNGKPIPIRTFSYEELILATNNFNRQLLLHRDAWYKFYKGSLEGRSICIKSYHEADGTRATKDMTLTDLAISAKLSAHQNILKLVGCCLETPKPTLVYEYAQNGLLANRIYRQRGTPMSWQSRLKIARQIAHAIAYLHIAFSRPIIHRQLRIQGILLDQNDVPKLSDFSICITIPEGEIDIEDAVIGTTSFICPSYCTTGKVTEKVYVYGSGSVLLELLTGLHLSDLIRQILDIYDGSLIDRLKNHATNEIVDPAILVEDGGVGVQQQLEAVLQLALVCMEEDPEKRPTMIDVTKELRRIESFIA